MNTDLFCFTAMSKRFGNVVNKIRLYPRESVYQIG